MWHWAEPTTGFELQSTNCILMLESRAWKSTCGFFHKFRNLVRALTFSRIILIFFFMSILFDFTSCKNLHTQHFDWFRDENLYKFLFVSFHFVNNSNGIFPNPLIILWLISQSVLKRRRNNPIKSDEEGMMSLIHCNSLLRFVFLHNKTLGWKNFLKHGLEKTREKHVRL